MAAMDPTNENKLLNATRAGCFDGSRGCRLQRLHRSDFQYRCRWPVMTLVCLMLALILAINPALWSRAAL